MQKHTRLINAFEIIIMVGLALSSSLVANGIRIPLAGAIVLLMVFLGLNLYFRNREGPNQVTGANEAGTIATQPNKTKVQRIQAQTQERIVRAAICGLGGLVGGFVWFLFGLIGIYACIPLFPIAMHFLKKVRIAEYEDFQEWTLNGEMFFAIWLILEFLAAYILIIHRGTLYINGVAVFPLVRTLPGFFLAIAGGFVGTVVSIFESSGSEAALPVKES